MQGRDGLKKLFAEKPELYAQLESQIKKAFETNSRNAKNAKQDTVASVENNSSDGDSDS